MSSQTIKLSDKADALVAQLQKMIFNRRRKKVTAAGVVETLVESAAKSSGDKRFATSWKNLIKDIDEAAKMSYAHGSKPSGLSETEWALVMSHRSRAGAKAKPAAKKTTAKPAAKKAAAKPVAAKSAAKAKPVAKKAVTKKAASSTTTSTSADEGRPARRARKSPSSLAARMAKAAKQAALT